MLKLENQEVVGWEHAIRGMRNPKNSWDRMDSMFDVCCGDIHCEDCPCSDQPACTTELEINMAKTIIGPNDKKLMMSLAKGGPVHAKYRRMITVYIDITAPLYWWKEFDTYKVGTVANSCSTMHKIHAKEFTLEDFSTEHLIDDECFTYPLGGGWRGLSAIDLFNCNIEALNNARKRFLEAKVKPMKEEGKRAGLMKKYWWQMIQLLPTSYNQKRTVMLNYEVLHNMYFSRKDHKLDEWHTFCDWIKELPYSELIIGKEDEND